MPKYSAIAVPFRIVIRPLPVPNRTAKQRSQAKLGGRAIRMRTESVMAIIAQRPTSMDENFPLREATSNLPRTCIGPIKAMATNKDAGSAPMDVIVGTIRKISPENAAV